MSVAVFSTDRRLLIGVPLALAAAQLVAGGIDLLLAAALDAIGDGAVTTYGAITALAGLAALVAYPVSGLMVDRHMPGIRGRSGWVGVGVAVSASGLVGFGQARDSTLLALTYVVAFGALPIVFVALYATIADRVPATRRGTAGALVGVATIVGGIAGNLLAARFAGAVAIGAAVFAVLLVAGAAAHAWLLGRSIGTPPVAPLDEKMAFARSGNWGDLAWFAVGRFALFLAYAAVAGLAYYIWRDHLRAPEPAAGVAAFALVSGTATLLASSLTGPWSDRVDARGPFVAGSALVMAAGVVAPLAVPTTTSFLVGGALIGLGFGTYLAVGTALATLLLPRSATFGRDLGLIGATNASAQAVAPAAASVIAASAGYTTMLALAAAACLVSAATASRIRSVR